MRLGCAHRVSICGGLDLPYLARWGGELHLSIPVRACQNDGGGQRAEREVRMRKDAGGRGLLVAGGWGTAGLEVARKWRIVGFAVRSCALL